ncbi:MAG: reverse transcriptase-like protein, partial [Burkholderiaceae bacterium]
RGHGACALLIHSDNSVLVEQLGPKPGPPIARLAPLFDEARQLLKGFGPVDLRWIPRHRNGEADALARQALGLAPKQGGTRKKKKPSP